MIISHLNLVALMRNGQRYPIVSVSAPRILEPRDGVQLPLESVMPLVQAQHRHRIVVDSRRWLLFAGTTEQADKWAQTNRMSPERMLAAWSPDDVAELDPAEWQIAAIGTWHLNAQVAAAAAKFARLSNNAK